MFQLLTFPVGPKSETELSDALELLDPSELFGLTLPHLSLQLGSILVPYFLPFQVNTFIPFLRANAKALSKLPAPVKSAVGVSCWSPPTNPLKFVSGLTIGVTAPILFALLIPLWTAALAASAPPEEGLPAKTGELIHSSNVGGRLDCAYSPVPATILLAVCLSSLPLKSELSLSAFLAFAIANWNCPLLYPLFCLACCLAFLLVKMSAILL